MQRDRNDHITANGPAGAQLALAFGCFEKALIDG